MSILAAGERAAGINGANRLGGTRVRPGLRQARREFAAASRGNSARSIDGQQVEEATHQALEPERSTQARGRNRCNTPCEIRGPVGIVRNEPRCVAPMVWRACANAPPRLGGSIAYNPAGTRRSICTISDRLRGDTRSATNAAKAARTLP